MIRPLDLADAAAVDALDELQRAAYAVEAELVGHGIPIPDVAGRGETFLVAERDGGVVGAVSYTRQGDTIDIHRLVVHPRHFRRGVASELLDALPAAERYVVATGADNAPARSLYEQRGFRLIGEREVAEGLRIAQYAMRRDKP